MSRRVRIAAPAMIESTKVQDLFPTPVWVVDLAPEIHQPMNADILRHLEAMIGEHPRVAPGGTLQTDTDLHTFDEFAELFAHIAAAAEGVLAFLKIDYDHFAFTGSWLNINPVGGINTPHTHPNNYLSGVYYVQTAAGADSIFFADPRPQASMISPPVREENIYTGNEASMEARDGRLILFPAWLSHGVPPNRSGRDRISVAVNIMFSSFTETMSRPKWQPTVRLKRGR